MARRWMRLWQGGSLDDFDELHAADFVDHAPAGRSPDLAGFRQGLVELYRAFPDFRAEPEDMVVDATGGKVAIRWTATGTHSGDFMGRPASGSQLTFRGIEIIQVAEGKVTARWGEWDGLDLLDQMGPRPPASDGRPRLELIILAVADLARAVGFYLEAFDWEVRAKAPVYVEFDLGGGRALGLYERKAFARNTGRVPRKLPDGAIGGTELYLRCEDVGAAVTRLLKAGARALSGLSTRDWGDEAAYLADPDGNVIVVARRIAAG